MNHEIHEINKITFKRMSSLKICFREFRVFRGKSIYVVKKIFTCRSINEQDLYSEDF